MWPQHPEGLAEPARACVGMLPGGVPHWLEVDVCPECAHQMHRRRHLWQTLTIVLIALLTSLLAYPLMP